MDYLSTLKTIVELHNAAKQLKLNIKQAPAIANDADAIGKRRFRRWVRSSTTKAQIDALAPAAQPVVQPVVTKATQPQAQQPRRTTQQPQPQPDRTNVWQWIAIIAIVLALIGMAILYVRSVNIKTAPQVEAELVNRVAELEAALSATPTTFSVPTTTPTATVTLTSTSTLTPTATLTLTTMPTAAATNLDAIHTMAGTPPFETVKAKDEKNRDVTILKGFDLKEWGGTTDPLCTRTELDAVELREEVGSADEPCVIILEWSLKDKDTTITSGFFAFHPREWIRFTFDQSHGDTRFVGTMWYIPKNWNAHMLAADLSGDWQIKNPTLTAYVGLSPTDPWVMGLWEAAEAIDQ